jgi:hypothetical protein
MYLFICLFVKCISFTKILNFFKNSDKDNDGHLNEEEFETLIQQLYTRKELISLFKL